MTRPSNREYELTSALIASEKRANRLIEDNRKLHNWIDGNENEIECLKQKIRELEDTISAKLKPGKELKPLDLH